MKPSLDAFLGERLARVLVLREQDKLSFKSIGLAMSCSAGNAAAMFHKAVRKRESYEQWESTDDIFALSVRAANCCANFNLRNRAEVEDAIKTGRLHPNNLQCRNYGWKSHREIHAWLGLPMPEKKSVGRPAKRPKLCPHCGGIL